VPSIVLGRLLFMVGVPVRGMGLGLLGCLWENLAARRGHAFDGCWSSCSPVYRTGFR